MKAKSVARFGLFLSLSVLIGYVEFLIPVLPMIPGAKLGLANIILLLYIEQGQIKKAVSLSVLRIILTAILFGGWLGALYSLGGTALAMTMMILLTKSKRFSTIAVSAAAGWSHNIGQTFVAMLLLSTKAVLSYLPYLCIIGMICGGVTGFLVMLIKKKMTIQL